MPEFYMIFARKISKFPQFYMICARKLPEFYIKIARQNFFPIFLGGGGGHVPPAPISYAHDGNTDTVVLILTCRPLVN